MAATQRQQDADALRWELTVNALAYQLNLPSEMCKALRSAESFELTRDKAAGTTKLVFRNERSSGSITTIDLR